MQFVFTAPSLTGPTFETLEEHSRKRFKKIERLVPNDGNERILRISVNKDGDDFVLIAEIKTKEDIFVKIRNRDLRLAIDEASRQLKQQMAKDKAKLVDLHKLRRGLDRFRARLFRRGME